MLIRTSRITHGKRPSGPTRINWNSPQARGLYARWPMRLGNPTLEQVGGYNIVPNANGLWRPSTFGGGMIDTTNVGVTHSANPFVPHSTRFTTDLGTELSVSCWFRSLAPTGTGNIGNASPFGKWDGAGWMIYVIGDKLRFYMGNTNTPTGTTVVDDSSKYFLLTGVASSTDAVTGCRLLVNGVREIDAAAGTIGSSTCDIQFGQYANSAGSSQDYEVFDCRLYKRALTDADVWQMYDPVTRWDLDGQPNTKTFFDMALAPVVSTVRFRDYGRRPWSFSPGSARLR